MIEKLPWNSRVIKWIHFWKILVLRWRAFLHLVSVSDSLASASGWQFILCSCSLARSWPHAWSWMMLPRALFSHSSPVASWRSPSAVRGFEKFCYKSNLLNFCLTSVAQTHLTNKPPFSKNTVNNPLSSRSRENALGNADFELRSCI